MTGHAQQGRFLASNRRLAAWGGAAALLLVPLVAMAFTDSVAWGIEDLVFAAVLIGGTGALFELALRTGRGRAYRAGAGLALAAAFVMVWANAAVGLVGSEDEPVNGLFFGVLAVGGLGALAARFRPAGMARTMGATALAQAVVGIVVLAAWPAVPGAGAGEIVAVTAVFAALWLAAAWLFRVAARDRAAP